MNKGFNIVSDAITLLRESDNSIEMLPLYSDIFLKKKKIGMEKNSINIKIDKFIHQLKPDILRRLLRSVIFFPQIIHHIIFKKQNHFITDSNNFKKSDLKYIICPVRYPGDSYIEKIHDKNSLMKKMVPQFLWIYNNELQEKQKLIMNKLLKYPAFNVYLGMDFFKNDTIFWDILDEIVQG